MYCFDFFVFWGFQEEWKLVSLNSLLTLSWRKSLLYVNQSTDLLCKRMDWFIYDRELRHERVNVRREIWRRSLEGLLITPPLPQTIASKFRETPSHRGCLIS